MKQEKISKKQQNTQKKFYEMEIQFKSSKLMEIGCIHKPTDKKTSTLFLQRTIFLHWDKTA